MQALEVAAVEKLQVHHPDPANTGHFPDHLSLPYPIGWWRPIVAGGAGTA
jgi:hypothetical protein